MKDFHGCSVYSHLVIWSCHLLWEFNICSPWPGRTQTLYEKKDVWFALVTLRLLEYCPLLRMLKIHK